MKQVKLISAPTIGSLEGNINMEITHLIESKRTDNIVDIKISVTNDKLIGMIIYEYKR